MNMTQLEIYYVRIGVVKMLNKLKYKISEIRKIFEIHCPDCGGIMKYEFYDPVHKVDVFKCQDCEKEWVRL